MSAPDTKLITGTIAPETKLTDQTNPQSVSLDSSMTFHTGSREVLRITNEARLVIGDGLSKEEATQETAKLLIAAFDERIQEMVDKRVSDLKSELEKIVLIAGLKADSNVELRLRAEKAEDETLVWRNRFASILWSGALNKSTVRDFKKWEAEYKAERNALIARAEKAEERLEWLERFLQHGGTSISTVSPYTLEDNPDDTDETQFNLPFQIGISVEMENRGCYKWVEFSNGAKGISPAIDAAKIKYAEWQNQMHKGD